MSAADIQPDFFIAGISHHSAGIELRERLNLNEHRQTQAYMWLHRRCIEGMLLSTCNRVEFMAHGLADQADRLAEELLSEVTQLSPEVFRSHLRIYRGLDAVRHAMRVASGLDSMVLGEPQILGQWKQAFLRAEQEDVRGLMMSRFGQRTLQVAKKVRTETKIGQLAVNLSTVAVQLAEEIFEPLADKRVLVLGAGEMAELAIAHFKSKQVYQLVVCNRTFERAAEVASLYGCEVELWEKRFDKISWADVVVVGLGGDFTMFQTRDLREAIAKHAPKPKLIIDLGVPRAVEPAVGKLRDVFLYSIDDLQRLAHKNLEKRAQEAVAAEKLIDDASLHFLHWYERQRLAPVLSDFSLWLESIRAQETPKSLKRAVGLSEEELIDHATSAVTRRLLKAVAQRANQSEQQQDWIAVLNQLTDHLESDIDNETESRIS